MVGLSEAVCKVETRGSSTFGGLLLFDAATTQKGKAVMISGTVFFPATATAIFWMTSIHFLLLNDCSRFTIYSTKFSVCLGVFGFVLEGESLGF